MYFIYFSIRSKLLRWQTPASKLAHSMLVCVCVCVCIMCYVWTCGGGEELEATSAGGSPATVEAFFIFFFNFQHSTWAKPLGVSCPLSSVSMYYFWYSQDVDAEMGRIACFSSRKALAVRSGTLGWRVWVQRENNTAYASCLCDNNFFTTTAVWINTAPVLVYYSMFFYLKLWHKSKEDEHAWHDSYGDKNMVNFIAYTRKKKKSHVDVTSIFLNSREIFNLEWLHNNSDASSSLGGRLLPQTFAPHQEQLKFTLALRK